LEKHLATAAYWIGILSTAIALIMRLLALMGIFAFSRAVVEGKTPITYRAFLDGAMLFFIMSIASGVIAWTKERKA
jgi:hypothetical protein